METVHFKNALSANNLPGQYQQDLLKPFVKRQEQRFSHIKSTFCAKKSGHLNKHFFPRVYFLKYFVLSRCEYSSERISRNRKKTFGHMAFRPSTRVLIRLFYCLCRLVKDGSLQIVPEFRSSLRQLSSFYFDKTDAPLKTVLREWDVPALTPQKPHAERGDSK